jgi:hypothetical protein
MADSSRQVNHSIRYTFTKLSPDSFFIFFSSFDETRTELGLDAEGLTETVLHLNLGYCLIVFEFCFFVFSPLMRQQQNYFSETNTRTGG